MKKLLTILLTLFMFITLLGCNSNIDEDPIIQEEEIIEEIIEDTPILGGWQDVEDGTLNDDLKNIFNSALEGLLGANYEPIELLATQVVNGTNYKFLASGTKTTNPIIEGTYNITVNKSSDGIISLVDIEVVEEKEKKKEVDKTMNYWVVFYNPDGLELDRQAIKYGTTPTYKGEDPIYWDNDYWYRFICWTDKQGNEIKEFTPITGNTYIYAKYEIGGENKPVVKEEPACLAEGTMITMADGSKRAIETLSEGDLIRVFNHDTGKVSSAKIMDYWQYEEKKSGLITLHFTNCIDVNIVTAHGFYNKEENKYVVLDATNINSYIGKHFYNVDNNSWETLLSATYSDEKVDTFFIATEGQFDTVAEGMLNVEDGIYYVLRNTFDFDNNMKIDETKKANDIECYGLFDSTDFEYLTKEAFEKYGAANLKVALGKGIITEEFLDILKVESITYESENIVEEYIPENVQHSVR